MNILQNKHLILGSQLEKKLGLDFYKYLEEGYREDFMPWAKDNGVNVIEVDWSGRRDVAEVLDSVNDMESLDDPFSLWTSKASSMLITAIQKQILLGEGRHIKLSIN